MSRTERRLFAAVVFATLMLLPSPAPGAGPPEDTSHTHIVWRGQTLGMIARRYNISVSELCIANNLDQKRPIFPGQKLTIPKPPRRTTKRQQAKQSGSSGKRVAAASRTQSGKKERTSGSQATKSKRKGYARAPRRKGFVILQGRLASWAGYAVNRDGSIPGAARDGFERALASWRTGKTERIHGRLIRMVTRVSNHFGGRPIVVVSGFRPPSKEQYTLRSKHNLGRAIDFRIPGVPNEAIRDFCRTLPDVGVGYYPNSSFVHLDIRERSAYWIDYSGPGEPPRYATASGEDPAKVMLAKKGDTTRHAAAARQAKTARRHE